MNETKKEIVSFFRKLAAMIDAGVPILRALRTILSETANEEMKAIVQGIGASIESGHDLRTALADYPNVFPPSLLVMVETGETTGRLEKVLVEIAARVEDGSLPVAIPVSAAAGETSKLSSEDVSILRLINVIICQAFKEKASDIHLESREDGQMRVRFRIDGVLHDADRPAAHLQKAIIRRIKIMADMNTQETRRPQDGRIMLSVAGKDIDIRVSVAPCIGGESLVMRLLSRSNLLLSLENQGFTAPNLKTLRGWSRRPNGIIIVTGPTGCGKTTTLYTLLQELNSPERKIMTVEDPVEYQIEGICQMRLDPSQGVTFAQALRCQLRQDPDIIMIGEIRDQETAYIAVQAALTGHLVLTTLHTNDAPAALRRLMDIGVAPFLVTGAVIGVLSQSLVRQICPDCREEAAPPDWVKATLKGQKVSKSFRGKGCKNCYQTGYRGRIGIHELLPMSGKVEAAVARDATAEEIRAAALASGMITKRDDGLAKAAEGITSFEEALTVCR